MEIPHLFVLEGSITTELEAIAKSDGLLSRLTLIVPPPTEEAVKRHKERSVLTETLGIFHDGKIFLYPFMFAGNGEIPSPQKLIEEIARTLAHEIRHQIDSDHLPRIWLVLDHFPELICRALTGIFRGRPIGAWQLLLRTVRGFGVLERRAHAYSKRSWQRYYEVLNRHAPELIDAYRALAGLR